VVKEMIVSLLEKMERISSLETPVRINSGLLQQEKSPTAQTRLPTSLLEKM
jgi:hypothetical protein